MMKYKIILFYWSVGYEVWEYILGRTGVNLQQILMGIAEENKKGQK